MDPQIGQVSGIPAVFVRTGRPFFGGVAFRVGTADEPVTWRGVSRAVRRLALEGIDQSLIESTTTPLVSMFSATGEPATVAGLLQRVTANLCSLPQEATDDLLRLLRAEATEIEPGPADDHLAARFGNSGLGATGLSELGLNWLGPAEIQTWASTHFNRDNACLFFAGEVVPSFHLDLPAGRRLLTPVPAPRRRTEQQEWLAGRGDAVAASWLSGQGPETTIVSGVIERLANQKLRDEEHLSHGVHCTPERIGAHKAQNLLLAAGFPNEATELQEAMMALVSQLGLRGCTQEDIDATVDHFSSLEADPRSAGRHAIDAAVDLLLGTATPSRTERDSRYRAVTPRDVALHIEQAWSDLVWTVGARPRDRRMVEYDIVHRQEVTGEVFPIDLARLDPETLDPARLPAAHVTVGAEGVSRNWNGRIVRVGWDTVEAVVRTPEGARTVLGRDGAVLSVEPNAWTNGVRLIGLIDDGAPANKVVQLQA